MDRLEDVQQVRGLVCNLHSSCSFMGARGGGLRHTSARFMPTDGDRQPLCCLESEKLSLFPPPSSLLPPRPLHPDVASCLKPWYRCHLVSIVTLEPVSSNLAFSLGRLFFLSAYLCLLLSIPWCFQPKMKGRECFPVVDLEGVKGQTLW